MVVSLGVAALLAVPAISWAQVLARNAKPEPLRLKVGDTIWVTEAPRFNVRQEAGTGVNRSWDALTGSVETGRKVTVTLMSSTNLEGRLLGIDERSITVEQPGGSRAIPATEVLRVRYAGVRKRHVLYGMLVGAVAGGLTLWAIDSQSSHPSSATEAVGLGAVFFGLPGGALVGAALPIGPPLYEAAPVTALIGTGYGQQAADRRAHQGERRPDPQRAHGGSGR